MEKPMWVKVVGTFLIILGCLGILGAWQTFNMPNMVARQKQMLPQIKQQLEQSKTSAVKTDEFMRMYEKMSDVPPWYGTWCLTTGAIALSLSSLFIFTAIGLFRLKKTAITLFYGVMIADIIFLVIRSWVGMTTMGWLGIATTIVGALAVIMNIILLFVVANGKKQVFLGPEMV